MQNPAIKELGMIGKPSHALIFICVAILTSSAMGSAQLKTLATFGAAPNSNFADPITDALVVDPSGNIYGACTYGPVYESGAGQIFELPQGSNTLVPIAEFNGPDGYEPQGMVMDNSGNLWGETKFGGPGWNPASIPGNTDGTIFEIASGSSTITTVAAFTAASIVQPEGGLVTDPAGNLYGITNSGGTHESGSVFRVGQGSNTITTLTSFANTADGVQPIGGVALDSAGDIFGTAPVGGSNEDGTIYELSKGSSITIPLASFTQATGAIPKSSLVMDSKGNLFGTTSTGGANNDGTLFELPAGSSTIVPLVSFTSPEGSAGILCDANGDLFGTTFDGGANHAGSVFEFSPATDTLSTVAAFQTGGSVDPYLLTSDAGGDLYGVTGSTIFEVTGSGFVVPEPSSIALMIALLGAAHWRNRSKSPIPT
jgi:uncharacterized repeat protein (TIGR03803 family)